MKASGSYIQPKKKKTVEKPYSPALCKQVMISFSMASNAWILSNGLWDIFLGLFRKRIFYTKSNWFYLIVCTIEAWRLKSLSWPPAQLGGCQCHSINVYKYWVRSNCNQYPMIVYKMCELGSDTLSNIVSDMFLARSYSYNIWYDLFYCWRPSIESTDVFKKKRRHKPNKSTRNIKLTSTTSQATTFIFAVYQMRIFGCWRWFHRVII